MMVSEGVYPHCEEENMMKKFVSLLLAVMMLLASTAAFAESAVSVILSTGTTQAFTADPVDQADLELILQAGLTATSAINQQPWFFAVVTNPDVMAELSGSGAMPAAAPAGNAAAPAGDASSGAPAGDAASSGAPAGDASSGDSAGDAASAGDSAGTPAAPAATGTAKAALGDSPVAIIIYMNEKTSSPNASFDCGLACQNMVIAASALGYGTKIISSPTMTLNGANHDALCQKLGVDPSLTALAVLLIGKPNVDAATSPSVRNSMDEKVSFVK